MYIKTFTEQKNHLSKNNGSDEAKKKGVPNTINQ